MGFLVAFSAFGLGHLLGLKGAEIIALEIIAGTYFLLGVWDGAKN